MRYFLLILLLTAPLIAQPRGSYLVGEHDGEDFLFKLRFQRRSVTIESLKSDNYRGKTDLEKVQSKVYRFEMPFPEEKKPVYVIQASKEEIVLTSPEEGEALRGYRERELPRWLNGKWTIEDGDKGIEFHDGVVTLHRGSESIKSVVYGLAPQGPVTRIILFKGKEPEVTRSVLLHLILVDETLMVWDQDDGKVKRFRRER